MLSVSDHQDRLRALSNKELIESFNKDVGNPGWVRARGDFHLAMVEEFKRRNFDYSAVGNEVAVSWAKRIKLSGNTITLEV